MNSNFQDVGLFHQKFGLRAFDKGPEFWDNDLLEFRAKFLQEELDEFNQGRAEHDHAKMADALIDLVYVAMGTAHLMGYPWDDLWAEVQRANMTKRRALPDGSDSVRGSSFDVVKPLGWKPPDIKRVLREVGFDC